MPDTLRAIILMVAGSFFFTLGDMFMKLASQTVPLGQVVVTLGLGLMVFFAVLARRDGQRFFERRLLHHAMAMRCIGEAVAIVGVPIALRFSPMATVSALMQSLPLVLTLMAVVFLREPLRWRRSIALIVGFLGVLVIIRPGLDTFDLFAAFTLLGVLGMAIRDLGTRIMPAGISTPILGFWGAVAIVLTGIGMILIGGAVIMPTREAWLFLIGLIIFGCFGTLAVAMAMRLGEVSLISPFRFIRVVFGVGVAVLILGESVEAPVIIGAAMVVGAGLYSLLRERQLALRAKPGTTGPSG